MQLRLPVPVMQVLLRPGMVQHAPAAGEAQMCINILRAAEFLCDDSNFKSGLIQRLSVEIALVLSMDPVLFKSRWGAGVWLGRPGAARLGVDGTTVERALLVCGGT